MAPARSRRNSYALRITSRIQAMMVVIALALILYVAAAGAAATTAALPFEAGEELRYEVSWLGISVGHATMRIEWPSSPTEGTGLRLVSLARTNKFLDTFYKVEDLVESLFDPCTRATRFFRIRQREGNYRSFREMTFDQSNHRVTYRKNDKVPHVIEINTTVQDPLSVLYAVRAMSLSVGQSVRMPIFDRGQTWDTEVRILKRERLELPIGTFNTLKVQPLLRQASMFRHKGEMFVWLTDDAQHVPVQMRSTIMIGAVEARLVDAKGVQGIPAQGTTRPIHPKQIEQGP